MQPECSNWKLTKDAVDIIIDEERRFFKLIETSKKTTSLIIEERGLSGETLSFLHHTHGIDPEIVNCYIELTPDLYKDYELCYAEHKKTGGEFK